MEARLCLVHPEARSEDSYRVDRRASAIRDWQQRDRQHELPPIPGRGRLSQRIEIGAVEEVHAEHRQREVVYGQPRQVARWLRHVAGGFPPDERNVPLA